LLRAAKPHRTDVAGIGDLPSIPDICYDEYDADFESNNLLDLGRAEAKAPIRLKRTESSSKQFGTRIKQANFGV
jgi:hypothetical protein